MDRRYKKRIDRYWKKMEVESNRELARIDPKEWFDLWHTHPDWEGKGNKHIENRKTAFELTYALLQKLEKQVEHRGSDIQCWAIFYENTADNAVYIHTENPNGSEFPFLFEGVLWGSKNQFLENIVDANTYEIGIFQSEDGVSLFLRKKA